MMYVVDLLPNGLFTNYPVFFAGALWGLTRGMSDPAAPPPPAFPVGYPAQQPSRPT